MIDEKKLLNEMIDLLAKDCKNMELVGKIVGLISVQPTIQPQGIDKDRLIEEIKKERYAFIDDDLDLEWNRALSKAVEIINQQPTTDVPDINDGKIPRSYKDRVEHVIKVLEFCKQRHIDIVTDLPHTVEIERGTISAYSMALKVVRECLLQPYKESE